MKTRRPFKPLSPDPTINKARERARKWYADRHQERLEYAARYRKENKEKVAQSVKAWADKHRDHLANYKETYYKDNKHVVVKYRSKNRKRIKAYMTAWHAENKEHELKRRRQYAASEKGKAIILNSQHKRRAQKRAAEHPATSSEIQELMTSAKACHYCKREGIRLVIDHFFPLAKKGPHSIENLVPACVSCNCRKKDRDPHEFIASLQQNVQN